MTRNSGDLGKRRKREEEVPTKETNETPPENLNSRG